MYKEKLCKEEAGREAQKKALVNRQIDLQNVKRNAISEKKDKQFNNHSEEINNLTCRLNDNETKNPKMNKSNSFDECKDNYENEKCFDASDEADSSNEEEKTYLCSENSKCYNKPKKHKNYKIRNRNINFQFSARAFPCASRESTLDSENKWLTKQKEMLCLSKSEESQFSQNENNPDWLEDKAK
ncbi:hypothetical protein A3Q56_07378 [Intoshia linei]|uniref:Uncharacterized protein n=1 Tax=Intoshia linei TaxID=1819745 RepID=A0A177ATS7_9BILA|nr:hypothetical protein A3Q56_07378 [Intoshia linei]